MRQIILTEEQKARWMAWAAVLDAEAYSQARGRLKSLNGGNCCLGVLCEVYQPPIGGEAGWQELQDGYAFGVAVSADTPLDTDELDPPKAVADWAGLDRDTSCWFASCNDTWGLSFTQIATVIRHAVRDDELPETRDEALELIIKEG